MPNNWTSDLLTPTQEAIQGLVEKVKSNPMKVPNKIIAPFVEE